jgi:acylphosphatase
MTVCKRVQYRGQVQGVGFRYTAQQLAGGFPIAGYVRNLSNGDVELVAEGDPAAVEAFLESVARRMGDYIADQTVSTETPSGLVGFRIRHS